MSGEQVIEYVCNLTTYGILIELKHVNVLYSVYTVVYAAYISRFNCINSAAVGATLKLPLIFFFFFTFVVKLSQGTIGGSVYLSRS